MIEAEWDGSAIRAPDWQNQARGSPALFAAVGRRAALHKQFDDAERFLANYIAISPDAWAYEMLAGVYRSQGDIRQWLATLEEFLKKSDDSGPDQARIQVQIADYYMNDGQWAKARPYAETAAATLAPWAMASALHCTLGMNDWKCAELWARRISERDANSSWDEWFLFCKRTGHGDVEAARAFAERHVAASTQDSCSPKPQDLGFFYWLGGSLRKAMDSFQTASESSRAMESGFYAGLVADALGDTAASDELYKLFVKRHHRDAPKTIQIWEILRQARKSPKLRAVDVTSIDQIISGLSDQNRWHMQFLVGEYLRDHGVFDLARIYLERCARSPHASKWFTALASDQLRELEKRELPRSPASDTLGQIR